MLHLQLDRLSFRAREDRDLFTVHFYVRSSKVKKRRNEGETRCIYDIAIVVENVDVSTDVKAL
jgi:hypothetical protein